MRKELSLTSLVFLFISFITAKTVFAQTESDSSVLNNVYLISPIWDSLDISKTGYFLSEIKDLRINKNNNGSITEKNGKSRLSFKDSLPLFLSSFIFPKTSVEKQNSITLNIEKFKCFASTNGTIDEAQLYIKVNFYDANKAEYVHTFERTFNYQKKSRPDFVSQLIYTAFKTAFARLKYNDKIITYMPSGENILDNTAKSPTYNSVYKPLEQEASPTKKDHNTYTIPIPKNKVFWENQDFYLSEIKDARTYKRNEGSVLSGIFNRRAEAKLDSSLEFYLSSTMSIVPDSSKKPLTLYVKTFTCSESLTALGERGSLFFTANLVLDSAGSNYIVYSKTLSVDSLNETDITKFWPRIISKTLEEYFNNFIPSAQKQMNGFISENEIIVEQFYYKNRYFWKGTELKLLKDFVPAFEHSSNKQAKQIFKTSKDLIRTGRFFTIVGGLFLTYAITDFLILDNKSIKNWYRAEPEQSSSIMPIDKRVFIWSGATSLITGFVCRTMGKTELLKAIGIYNKSVAEKVSFNFTPDFHNQGYLFQLNLLLGQK